jgi:hypothetical protein
MSKITAISPHVGRFRKEVTSAATSFSIFYVTIDEFSTGIRFSDAGNAATTVKVDPLNTHIIELHSFTNLEEDEDYMAVDQKVIMRAETVLKKIYAMEHLLPFFTVPTRSGGVALEYRQDKKSVYYRFDANGSMKYSLLDNTDLKKKEIFTDPTQVPTPSQILA